MLAPMKGVLVFALAVVLAGAGMRMAGVPIPLLDYPIGPIGVDTPGPAMPNVEVRPPGFDDLEVP